MFMLDFCFVYFCVYFEFLIVDGIVCIDDIVKVVVVDG